MFKLLDAVNDLPGTGAPVRVELVLDNLNFSFDVLHLLFAYGTRPSHIPGVKKKTKDECVCVCVLHGVTCT